MPGVETETYDEKTNPLEGSLRIRLDKAVLILCHLSSEIEDNVAHWLDKHNGVLSSILDNDEEVKELARLGNIKGAAILVKEKLDEYFGYDVSGFYEV